MVAGESETVPASSFGEASVLMSPNEGKYARTRSGPNTMTSVHRLSSPPAMNGGEGVLGFWLTFVKKMRLSFLELFA